MLLNKSDMADPARTAEWVDYFKQHKTVAIPIDCKTGKGLNRLLPEIKNILREQIAAWERKGMVGRPIRIMLSVCRMSGNRRSSTAFVRAATQAKLPCRINRA